MADRPDTPRARARAETTDQIKRIAREHLAAEGPNLSLRAVARDLGVVSSAVYRYFASRDELLTALIIDAYTSLAEVVEQAEATVPRRDLTGRWLAVGRGVRGWALANRHEYALLYGSPVPGYAAPRETVVPAARPALLLVDVVRDGLQRGIIAAPADRLSRALRADLRSIGSEPEYAGIPPTLFARLLGVWAHLFGVVSFELFGRLTGGITDYDAYFEYELRGMARRLGLP